MTGFHEGQVSRGPGKEEREIRGKRRRRNRVKREKDPCFQKPERDSHHKHPRKKQENPGAPKLARGRVHVPRGSRGRGNTKLLSKSTKSEYSKLA